MNKSCPCGNITVEIAGENPFHSARKCQCHYCVSNNVEYVSDPQIEIQFDVSNSSEHRIVRQGQETADFQECTNCGLVLVTSHIEGRTYCVLNAKVLGIAVDGQDQILRDFSAESPEKRLARRKLNWSPVRTHS